MIYNFLTTHRRSMYKQYCSKSSSVLNIISILFTNAQTYAPSRSLRSASERRLVVPSQRGTKSLSRTFSWTVPSWWNDLPISIRTAESLAIFKKHPSQVIGVWCLVMSFCLKVCIYSHTRGVKLRLGLGFMQTSQVLPHWLNQSFSFWTLSYTQRHCHVRIEKGPVQTVAIILEAHNFLEYHYML